MLVLTSVFAGGSWICIEKVLERLDPSPSEVLVLGLGRLFHRRENLRYFTIPYPRFDRWGYITAYSPVLGFLWNLPLLLVGTVALLVHRPRMVISNGFALGMVTAPLVRILGSRSVVMFHGYIGGYLGRLEPIAKWLGGKLDLAVVNSRGSHEDATRVIDPSRVVVSEHSADPFFFAEPVPEREPGAPLTVFFVGRLDPDKYVYPLIEVARRLVGEPGFRFVFAGVGKFQREVEELARAASNVEYPGYVSDRGAMRSMYREADAVWSFADVTYLALPAVEALACGTPIIVSRYAALSQLLSQALEIDRGLVPPEAGWIIDPDDIDYIEALLRGLERDGVAPEMRRAARDLALRRYGDANLDEVMVRVRALMGEAR
ncbi:MAG: glycosyltransferase [Actinobacteria bacterium]|nr:glycosyltransferase [Actinomycetota bacterium]MBU1942231.1 glycosyltransferase [Actinomycetota bacterium]MBU2687420.1 glycosyltransferase [Actinomycetota bacterium]